MLQMLVDFIGVHNNYVLLFIHSYLGSSFVYKYIVLSI